MYYIIIQKKQKAKSKSKETTNNTKTYIGTFTPTEYQQPQAMSTIYHINTITITAVVHT